MPPPRPMTGRGISLDLLHCPLGSVTGRTTPPVLGFGGSPEPQSPPIRGDFTRELRSLIRSHTHQHSWSAMAAGSGHDDRWIRTALATAPFLLGATPNARVASVPVRHHLQE
jgi:hypothetical protein